MKVLVVGSGGREHALVWKLAQSPSVTGLFAAPGNPGTRDLAQTLEIGVTDRDGLRKAIAEHGIELVVVGPEAPLAKGLADVLREDGVLVFGPGQAGAELESSKAYSKELMNKNGIPTAGFRIVTSAEAAREYLDGAVNWPVVLKASGLAAGKGVLIVKDREEAEDAIKKLMVDRSFGQSGDTVVIEDFLSGFEVSVHAITDGDAFFTLPTSQDHKRAFDGDEGPNTGGMGAYSPARGLEPKAEGRIESEVLAATLHALKRAERPYRGALYAGLMMTRSGARVLEYNVRFGDPETQVLLPRLRCDLALVLAACARGELADLADDAFGVDERVAVGVVAASGGYPGAFPKDVPIEGLEEAAALPDVEIFHAGTRELNGQLVTAGGRVLTVVGLGKDHEEARQKAYAALEKIRFEGMFYRKDIGA